MKEIPSAVTVQKLTSLATYSLSLTKGIVKYNKNETSDNLRYMVSYSILKVDPGSSWIVCFINSWEGE